MENRTSGTLSKPFKMDPFGDSQSESQFSLN